LFSAFGVNPRAGHSSRPTTSSPNLNAFVERWIQSIKHECLNHFIILGEAHLNYLVRQYVEHYHTERPHQGIGNVPNHAAQSAR